MIDTRQSISQLTVADLNSYPGAMCDEGVGGKEKEGKGVSTSLSFALPAGRDRRGSALFSLHTVLGWCVQSFGRSFWFSPSLGESLIQGFIILSTSDPW